MAKRLAQFAAALDAHPSELARFRASEPAACSRTDAELMSFLLGCDMDVAKAAEKLRVANAALADYGAVTMEHVAPFLRAPSPSRELPDGSIVLLEDGCVPLEELVELGSTHHKGVGRAWH